MVTFTPHPLNEASLCAKQGVHWSTRDRDSGAHVFMAYMAIACQNSLVHTSWNPQRPFSFLNGHWEPWTDLPSWHINNRL